MVCVLVFVIVLFFGVGVMGVVVMVLSVEVLVGLGVLVGFDGVWVYDVCYYGVVGDGVVFDMVVV